ncbi:MAG: hypothetical protein ACLQD8_04795 [Thermoplasmata archaeon]
MLALNLGNIVQVILFLLFADLTALVAAVIGPTYDQLLVPELSPASLYPPLYGNAAGPGNFLAPAAHFSEFLVASVVDPAMALVGLGVAVLYLARTLSSRWSSLFDGLLPRLVLAVVGANFAVPIGGALLGLAGSLYPVVSGWDGGSWQHWVNLAGFGEVAFSWDNGVLAFVLSLVEFAIVFALVLAIGVRDALLAVLLVLLPVFTLVWPFRPLSPLARRAWLWFVELAFLPCVLVVPLELAVHSPNPVILVGYLGVALASPALLSIAGTNVAWLGFPSPAGTVGPAVQRSVGTAPSAPARFAAPALPSPTSPSAGAAGRAAAGGLRAAGTASAPMAAPLVFAELVGHGAAHLTRHMTGGGGRSGGPPRVPPLRPGGPV